MTTEALEKMLRSPSSNALAALIIWNQRMQNPDMAVQIGLKDCEAMVKCVDYLGVTPSLTLKRPKDKEGNHRDYVIVALVDEKTGDSFKAVESEEDRHAEGAKAAAMKIERDSIPNLTATILAGMARGEYSDQLIEELCHAANNLVKFTKP